MSAPVRLAPAVLFALLALQGCGRDLCDAGPGTICTVVGTGEALLGDEGTKPLETPLYWPQQVAFDPKGRMAILDWNNHRIRMLENGIVKTKVGTYIAGDGADDNSDATSAGAEGTTVNLNHPTEIFWSNRDNVFYFAAWHNHKIRKWDPDTNMVWVVTGSDVGTLEGPAATARYNQPSGVTQDQAGNLYIADQRNERIQKLDASTNMVGRLVGTMEKGFNGDGQAPPQTQINFPTGSAPLPASKLAVDSDGRIYFCDTDNHRVRRVDPVKNTVETIAGNGTAGNSGDGSAATDAELNQPRDVKFGPDGSLYIADSGSHVVRKVDMSSGIITTVVGTGEKGFGGDGEDATKAKLNSPFGLAFDSAGNLYVADTYNMRIRRVQTGALK